MNKNIRSTTEIGRTHGAKIILYGLSGVGKTYSAVGAPAPLIISAEKGLLTLRDFNLPAWEIKGMGDLSEVFKYLTQSGEARQFKSIILDSCSDIAETCYAEIAKKTKDPRKLYPEMQEKVTQAFRDFRDLPNRHVIMLAKAEERTDTTGAKSYIPSFPGNKLAQAAPYFVDEVFYLHTWVDPVTGQRFWGYGTSNTSEYWAKDRSARLAQLENADPKTGGGLGYVINKMLA